MALLFTVFSLLLAAGQAQSQVVLIDPGHGGEDCGAKTRLETKKGEKKICEKELALSISKKIHKALKPHFKVFLTRSVDRTLSLQERADIAEKISADIFLSVHVNSSYSNQPHGYETFYLDNHDNAAVKKVESIENRDSEGDEVVINQILADLVIERTAPSSKKLASSIHQNIHEKVKSGYQLVDRGMKPALFYVLALSKRPAALLEAGFISNEDEIQTILSKEFQTDYANGVAKGVREYFNKMKGQKASVSLF